MPTPVDLAKLSGEHRRWLDSWLAEFERSWRDGLLDAWVRELPAPGSTLRLPALVAMVAIDLRKQWQHGRHALLEGYLHVYPELGDAATVPIQLLEAEWEARRQAGRTPEPAEFARRFPQRADDLRRLGQPASASDAAQATRVTRSLHASTHSSSRPASGPALPEQFGRYRILQQLGQGGMGAVYLAHDSQLDRPVALKVPHFAADDPEGLARFLREARLAATLSHPSICPVHDVGQIDGIHYVTMAYIDGKPLADLLGGERPLPERSVAAVVRKLALALAEAHAHGVIHRDLKPSNVMINRRHEPIVMDFGLARRVGQEDVRLTRSGSILGTPAYMSPEQVDGNAALVGPCSDVYSLGVILYEMLTGRLPFEGSTASVLGQILTKEPPPPSSHRPGLDAALEAICLKAMAKDPAQRYASMTEFADALRKYLKGGGDSPQEEVVLLVPEPPEVIPVVKPVAGPSTAGLATDLLASMAGRAPASSRTPIPPPLPPDVKSERGEAPTARVRQTGRMAARTTGVVPVSPRPTLRQPPPSRKRNWLALKLAGVALFFLAGLGVIGWAVYAYKFSAQAQYKEGQARAKRGDYTGAIEAYSAALRRNDRLAAAHVGRAAAYFRQAEYDKVVTDCAAALAIDTGLAAAYCYRGGAYNRLGDFERAIQDCDEAIRLDRNFALAYAFRGDAYGNMANCSRGKEDLDRAIELDRDLALAYAYRSDIQHDSHHVDLGIVDATRAIELDPGLGIAYAYRGVCYAHKGQKKQAQDDFDQALRLAPNEAEVYNSRGVAQGSGDPDLALTAFSKAIELCPRFAEYHSNRARTRAARGQLTEALEDASRAIDISRNSASAHCARGQVYLQMKKYAEALADSIEAIRLNPSFSQAHVLRGLVHLQQDQDDQAVEDFTRAIELNPRDYEAYLCRAIAHNRKGRHDQALEDCRKAEECGLPNDDARCACAVARGSAHLGKKDLAAARKSFQEALKYSPDHAEAREGLRLASEPRVAPPVTNPPAGARAWVPGERMSHAIRHVMKCVREISDKTPYGYNEGVCILGAFLAPHAAISFTMPLGPNIDYAVIAAAGNDGDQVGVEVLGPDGQPVAQGIATAAGTVAAFRVPANGTYTLRQTLTRSQRASFCAMAVLREGGIDVPLRNLETSSAGIITVCSGVARKSPGTVVFQDAINQWALFGGIVAAGQSFNVNNLRLGQGRRWVVAAGDEHASTIDLLLLNRGQVAARDGTADARPVLSHDATAGIGYDLNVKNTRADGRSLILAAILRAGD
jgi:serine/threonine protein kinase/tetratricopeptide (TPR) repeat protein